MTRFQALAHNTGVEAAIALAKDLTEDIRGTATDDLTRRTAIAALEAFYEAAATLLVPVPSPDEGCIEVPDL